MNRGVDQTHPFVTRTELSASEAKAAFSFLKRQDLIEESGDRTYQVTEKGFDVARDDRSTRATQNTNRKIKWLTVATVAVALLQFVGSIFL